MIVLYGAAVLVVLSGVVAMSLHKLANRPVLEIVFRRLSSDVSRSWKFYYIILRDDARGMRISQPRFSGFLLSVGSVV